MPIERTPTSDVIDASDYYIESVIDDAVAEAMRKAAAIPVGAPGECDGCGEFNQRIVNGHCSPCRDIYGME